MSAAEALDVCPLHGVVRGRDCALCRAAWRPEDDTPDTLPQAVSEPSRGECVHCGAETDGGSACPRCRAVEAAEDRADW